MSVGCVCFLLNMFDDVSVKVVLLLMNVDVCGVIIVLLQCVVDVEEGKVFLLDVDLGVVVLVVLIM